MAAVGLPSSGFDDRREETTPAAPRRGAAVPFWEAFRFWLWLGFVNFGGPAGQIALMQRELVERRKWIGEGAFLRALSFCMVLPGPEAQQLAIYVGWRLNGYLGGIVAGSFFVLPSIAVLWGLAYATAAYGSIPWVNGLLYGVQPVVIAVVVEAVLRIGKSTLHHAVLVAFAVAAFVAIYVLHLYFPVVVGAAALGGFLLRRRYPDVFTIKRRHGTTSDADAPALAEPEDARGWGRTLRIALVCLVAWLVPVVALWLWRGGADVLAREALFFSQTAFVTFGGAYAVLAYVARVTVNDFGWLSADQMVTGLGLAESTPGPLIMVTEYVGFLAGWNNPGGLSPLVAGTVGALVTTYVTFLPCFLFIFVGAPYIEAIGRNERLGAALAGVTAAVVGVVANLAVFFAAHVLFRDGRFDLFAAVLAVASFAALQRFHVPVYYAIPVGALLGMTWRLAGL